jgi:hypothetical protein
MKAYKIIIFCLFAAFALIITGCPSPVANSSAVSPAYETSATIDESRMVFVEEDGTEIPLVTESGDGPAEIIDFTVLDDSDSESRSSYSTSRVRCIVIGRRHDGRSGIWLIYRSRGMVVVPNEEGVEDSLLMELVEVDGNPWYGDDWVYEARAISDDGQPIDENGKIIIGQLRRPDGWKYEEYFGDDVPAPEIGVWWSLYLKNDKIYISRARPMLMMHEPEPENTVARHSGGRQWIRNWIELLIEWIQINVLSYAWNYMADVVDFVDPGDVTGGIPDGFYVVSGTDKYGVDSWAWLTASSMEDIVDAPGGGDPPVNNPPWPVTGVVDGIGDDPIQVDVTEGTILQLIITGASGDITVPPFDPDGDVVTFTANRTEYTDSISPAPPAPPELSIDSSGAGSISNWDDGFKFETAKYTITIADDEGLFQTTTFEVEAIFY